MKKSLFLSAALLASPLSLRAGNVAAGAPVRASLPAWGAPLVQTFVYFGHAQMSSNPLGSIKGLSGLVLQDAVAAAHGHAAFQRLADALQVQGIQPQQFIQMNGPARLAAMEKAAAQAEGAADADADFFLAQVPERLDLAAASKLEDQAKAMDADALYLNLRKAERVRAIYKEVSRLKKAHEKAVQDWLQLTQARMAAGDFDGPGLFQEKDGRWMAADEIPGKTGDASLSVVFQNRVSEADSLPQGPWKTAMYGAMIASLSDPAVSQRLSEEKQDPAGMRETLTRKLETAMPAANPKVETARRALAGAFAEGKTPAMRHIVSMLKHYDAVSRVNFNDPAQSRWRVARVLWDNKSAAQGYPALDVLQGYAKDIRATAHRRGIKSMLALFASLLILPVSKFFQLASTATLNAVGVSAIAVSMALFFAYLWRRDSTAWLFSGDEARFHVDKFGESVAEASFRRKAAKP